jgi:FdhE protein
MSERTSNEIEEWQKKTRNSAPLAEFYDKLTKIQSKVEHRIMSWEPPKSSETYHERLQQGLPLLQADEIKLDWSLFQDVFTEVALTFGAYPQLFNVPDDIPGMLQKLSVNTLVRAWYEQKKLPEIPVGIDQDVLVGMISAAVKPFLTTFARTLSGHVNQQSWRRGYCPICGGSPDFAFLDEERGARWLVCSQCDTRWLFQRLECPYCGTQDQNSLAYLTDDQELYRLYTCERCKRYLKTIDLRHSKKQLAISMERLLTMNIDSQARRAGYS